MPVDELMADGSLIVTLSLDANSTIPFASSLARIVMIAEINKIYYGGGGGGGTICTMTTDDL